MIKLYKHESNAFYYAECWVENGLATVHTGIVGTVGECFEEDCPNAKSYLKAFKSRYEAQGYRVIPDKEMYWITVCWEIASAEPDKAEEDIITAVYDDINEAFGWLGLGYADGFEVENKNDGYFVKLYALSVDRTLGEEAAKNAVDIDKDFIIDSHAF